MLSIQRSLQAPSKSFFLSGPRGVGKSTWLKNNFAKATVFNLLDQRLFLRLSKDPGALKEELMALPKQTWVVLDEIQKVPALLDVVHVMIEERALKFALSGSSARKLKRGGGNLLAGRAVTRAAPSFTYLTSFLKIAFRSRDFLKKSKNQKDRIRSCPQKKLKNF